MFKECLGCGIQFETLNPNVNYHKKDCGRKRSSASRNGSRTKRREVHDVQFIGVDGEGIGRPTGDHDYILLSVGTESLFHSNGSELTTLEIFDFLYSQYERNPNAVFVGYYLGYDFTMWLKGLPEERARMLLTEEGIAKRKPKSKRRNPTPFPVEWEGWEFDALGLKRFKLRRLGTKNWMYICDVGSFFQTSFLKAIDPREWPTPLLSEDEYAVILEGKSERNQLADYGTAVSEDMIRYNLLENDVLARLMKVTNEGFTESGVRLNKAQWFGPGQAAQKWLKNIGAPTGDEIRTYVPEEVNAAAQASYYGGWFEIFAHGHVKGKSYEYDINSAYPYIIAELPCLQHATWENETPDTGEFGLIYCTVTNPSGCRIGPMPYRTRKGGVLRPLRARGWYWRHELDAASRAFQTEISDVTDGWRLQRCSEGCKPFGSIRELYQQRISVGKKSPQGKGLKLIYNSAYGKQAQSVGNPLYGNALYASLITAGCRTMILDAIATHPKKDKGVLMVATDGVYFTDPHPSLHIDSEELGAWDSEERSNLTLFKPGVYWDDSSRARIAEGARSLGVKSRGVNQGALAEQITAIDEAFKTNNFPQITLTIPFSIVSPKLALARGKWDTCGKVTHGTTVIQSANPSGKRNPFSVDNRTRPKWSKAWKEGDPLESTPYDKMFGLELQEALLETDALTPEGNYAMLIAEAFGMG